MQVYLNADHDALTSIGSINIRKGKMSTANSNNIYNLPNQNKFYVYLHIDPRNNEVFYVGKGCNNRAYDFSESSRSTYHHRLLNKLYKKSNYSKNQIVHIYKDNLNEQCAFCLERILINKYGRKDLNKGTLLNFTDGGDGISGRIITEECKNNMSKAQLKRFKTYGNPNKGRKFSEETKQKMSKSTKERFKIHDNPFKGKQHNDESKQKMSKSHKGKKLSKNHKNLISKKMKSYYKINTHHQVSKSHCEETKQKMSISHCKYIYWYFDKDGNKIKFSFTQEYDIDHNFKCGVRKSTCNNKPYKGIQYYRRLLTEEEKQKLIEFSHL